MGGILTGVRDNIAENDRQTLDTNNIQERNIIAKNSTWKILTICNNGKTKDIYETLTRGTEGPEQHNLIIGGDFNARIGRKGGIFKIDGLEEERKSKDKITNQEGEKLLTMTENR